MAARPKIDTSKVRHGFRSLAKDKVLVALACAAFHKALTGGLVADWRARQGDFAPLSPDYAEWKKRRGLGPRIWQASGATVAAITDNPPEKPGLKKGLQFTVGKRGEQVFAVASPKAFRNRKGKKLGRETQSAVYKYLTWGSARTKIAALAAKKGWTSDEQTEYLRKRGLDTSRHGHNPGRKLLGWNPEWRAQMSRNIEAAIARAVRAEGMAPT